jgi:hypothetical protein
VRVARGNQWQTKGLGLRKNFRAVSLDSYAGFILKKSIKRGFVTSTVFHSSFSPCGRRWIASQTQDG